MKDCCQPKNQDNGLKQGIFLGLVPHSFCIGFIVFSILGTTVFSVFFRQLMMIPRFFEILTIISPIIATLSAIIYLKKLNLLSFQGIKTKKEYLSILYLTVIIVNLLFVNFVFPKMANFENNRAVLTGENLFRIVLDVNIPCSGHAFLISSELREIDGVRSVIFNNKGNFEVDYDPQKTSLDQILQIKIFKTYPAKTV